jgi:hypothetical protein
VVVVEVVAIFDKDLKEKRQATWTTRADEAATLRCGFVVLLVALKYGLVVLFVAAFFCFGPTNYYRTYLYSVVTLSTACRERLSSEENEQKAAIMHTRQNGQTHGHDRRTRDRRAGRGDSPSDCHRPRTPLCFVHREWYE